MYVERASSAVALLRMVAAIQSPASFWRPGGWLRPVTAAVVAQSETCRLSALAVAGPKMALSFSRA